MIFAALVAFLAAGPNVALAGDSSRYAFRCVTRCSNTFHKRVESDLSFSPKCVVLVREASLTEPWLAV